MVLEKLTENLRVGGARGGYGSLKLYQLNVLSYAAHIISRISDIVRMHKCTTLWSTQI